MERDEMGFINLDNVRLVDNTFYMNGNKYFYKLIKNIYNTYNEMVAEEIANDLEIKCAHFDIGVNNGTILTFSEDIFKNNRFISMNEILSFYYTNTDIANNLTDVKNALDIYLKGHHKDIMENIYRMVVFNFYIANHDSHNLNYGLLFDGKYELAPLFDNIGMLNEESIFDGIYSLGIDSNDYYSDQDIFIKFIECYPEYLKYIKDNINVISSHNIECILQKIEKRIEANIPSLIRKRIKNDFVYNNKCLKNKMKSL